MTGADSNVVDNSDESAVFVTINKGRIDLVEILISAGADVKYQITPFTLAIFKGNTELVKILISAGADVNRENTDGMSSLMIVAGKGDV